MHIATPFIATCVRSMRSVASLGRNRTIRPASTGEQHETHGSALEAETPFDVFQRDDGRAENDDAHRHELVVADDLSEKSPARKDAEYRHELVIDDHPRRLVPLHGVEISPEQHNIEQGGHDDDAEAAAADIEHRRVDGGRSEWTNTQVVAVALRSLKPGQPACPRVILLPGAIGMCLIRPVRFLPA